MTVNDTSAGRFMFRPGCILTIAAALVLMSTAAGAAVASAKPTSRMLWIERYDNHEGAGEGVVVSPDGTRVYVTGSSQKQPGSPDYYTIAYDAASGKELWNARYDGGFTDDEPKNIAVSPDGSAVFVTGESGQVNAYNIATVAYKASTGRQLWVAEYNGSDGNDVGWQVRISPDSATVFVAGWSGPVGAYDYVTLSYDALTGAQRWVARYDGPGHGTDAANGLAVDAEGVYVTGQSAGKGTGDDVATIAYDAATDQKLWVNRYDDPAHGDDHGSAIALSADGSGLYVSGSQNAGNQDYLVISYDPATGKRRWVSSYDGTAHGIDQADSIALSPSGDTLYAVGSAQEIDFIVDAVVVAYDAATGQQRWVGAYDAPTHKGAAVDYNAGAANPNGTAVYVVAWSSGGTKTADDYATIAFDSGTGAQLWAERYDGPGKGGEDYPAGVSVNPAGTAIYMTGISWAKHHGHDIATIAYQA